MAKSFRLFATLSSIFVLANQVFACGCEVPTICQAYTRAGAVFTGILSKIEKDENSSIETVFAHFTVEKTFKGRTGKIEVVKFIIGSCEKTFKIGEKYFVYKESDSSVNRVCNLTDTLDRSISDLEYASSLSETTPIFTISGRIDGLSRDEIGKAKLIIKSQNNRRQIPLDNDGFFDFAAKEDTTYQVKILLPFEATIFIESLGEGEKLTGTIVEYSLPFRPNECDYRKISVSKIDKTAISKSKNDRKSRTRFPNNILRRSSKRPNTRSFRRF